MHPMTTLLASILTHVAMFFRKPDEIMKWHNLTTNVICNVDEIGITNRRTPVTVIAKWGAKQVGAMITG